MGFRSTLAICVSVALHGATITLLSGARAADRVVEQPDVWRGDTVDIEPLFARTTEARDIHAGAKPSVASPPAPPLPQPQPTQVGPKEPAQDDPPPKPTPAKPPLAKPAPPAEATAALATPPSPEPSPPAPSASTESAPTAPSSPAQPPSEAREPSAHAASAPSAAESGAESDLPAGVRRLDKAFVRAITAASHRDPYFRSSAAGFVGSARIRLSVDAEGKLGEMVTQPKEVGEAISRVLGRTALLLRSGRFALPSGVGAGVIDLELDIALSDGPPAEDADDATATVSMGFTPPTASKAGRAYFTLASGRRFEATVVLRN